MAYDEQNIFAKILRGEIPCKTVYENDYVLAFEDIDPKAPVHILVIPKSAYVSIDDFGLNAPADEVVMFYKAIAEIVKEQNIAEEGFRCIANTGIHGGQEVPHFHMHILAGRPIGPMVA